MSTAFTTMAVQVAFDAFAEVCVDDLHVLQRTLQIDESALHICLEQFLFVRVL
jgi:hypothetical protein